MLLSNKSKNHSAAVQIKPKEKQFQPSQFTSKTLLPRHRAWRQDSPSQEQWVTANQQIIDNKTRVRHDLKSPWILLLTCWKNHLWKLQRKCLCVHSIYRKPIQSMFLHLYDVTVECKRSFKYWVQGPYYHQHRHFDLALVGTSCSTQKQKHLKERIFDLGIQRWDRSIWIQESWQYWCWNGSQSFHASYPNRSWQCKSLGSLWSTCSFLKIPSEVTQLLQPTQKDQQKRTRKIILWGHFGPLMV